MYIFTETSWKLAISAYISENKCGFHARKNSSEDTTFESRQIRELGSIDKKTFVKLHGF